ncbi:MAG: S-layer homology domain-containing protein [Leptolyngbya sp. SIO1E4]|nr:S-layer homology domain-containing protein [Leptolyngbya sp. SIO1E4]
MLQAKSPMVGGRVRDAIASVVALGLLASCAGGPFGEAVERSLEADPQLEESPAFGGSSAPEPEDEPPSDTPQSPRSTDDAPAAPAPDDPEETASLLVVPEPGEADFIGPVWPAETLTAASSEDGHRFQDNTVSLEGIPVDLQAYIQDLQALDLIAINESPPADGEEMSAGSPFNQTITRREYAQWLFDAYNTLHADEPGERLRAGVSTDETVFQDVATTDAAFAAIQGLAAAGIIPSPLTGNGTAVTFRPDAPLAREDLVLWKVPLDTRSTLPNTSPEAVTETWGFQDAASVEPLALRAIAADFQLGDFSNIRRAFGYTTLFRPDKAVTRAEAAAVIWRFGDQTNGRSAAQAASSDE